jgi:excisionase family DNA binding protein
MLTRQEVAKLLHVEIHTIARWVQQGDLVGHKLGTTWRFDPDDVATFLRDRSTARSTGFTSPEAVA